MDSNSMLGLDSGSGAKISTPSAQSPDYYLRAKIRYLLLNIDSIKPSRLRGKVQDRLRDLVNELRGLRDPKGKSIWPLVFAALAFCAFVLIAHPWAKTSVYCSTCTPQTSFRVLKSFNKRDFLLQRVVDGIPEAPEMRRFDEDAPLEMGFTLTYLKFEDRGSVWSVRGIDPWFRLERNDKGWPTLPSNCRPNLATDHTECKGEPKW